MEGPQTSSSSTQAAPARPWALPGIPGLLWEFQPVPSPPSHPGIPAPNPTQVPLFQFNPFPVSWNSIPQPKSLSSSSLRLWNWIQGFPGISFIPLFLGHSRDPGQPHFLGIPSQPVPTLPGKFSFPPAQLGPFLAGWIAPGAFRIPAEIIPVPSRGCGCRSNLFGSTDSPLSQSLKINPGTKLSSASVCARARSFPRGENSWNAGGGCV